MSHAICGSCLQLGEPCPAHERLAEDREDARAFDEESDTRGTRAERAYERMFYGD